MDSSKSHHLFYHANCVIPSMRKDIIAGDFGHGGVTQGEIARVVRIAKEEEGKAERLEELEMERKEATKAKKAHASAKPAKKAAPMKKKAAPGKKTAPKKKEAAPGKESNEVIEIEDSEEDEDDMPVAALVRASAKKAALPPPPPALSQDHSSARASDSAITTIAASPIAASHEALAKDGGLTATDKKDMFAIQKAMFGIE